MTVVAAAIAVAVAVGLVLHDVRRPLTPPAPGPDVPVVPPPVVAGPAFVPQSRSESVLASIADVEADQRPPVLRRLTAALALFVFTLLVAGAVAAGIYRAVRSFG